ncbi:MAG: hypothetical protein GY861_06585, partial [bacterium]|nr:hypothetical protein [bacterium]
MKAWIKTSFEQDCFDRAYFKLADSRNLHILPYHLQFLSSRLIDCRCEQNSKLFYAYEESGCFAKDLSYLITATNDQSQIRSQRRMPQKPNNYKGGRRKAEKRKRDGISQSSGQSLDEAIYGGVRTSSDTHSIGSEIRTQPTVVGAPD